MNESEYYSGDNLMVFTKGSLTEYVNVGEKAEIKNTYKSRTKNELSSSEIDPNATDKTYEEIKSPFVFADQHFQSLKERYMNEEDFIYQTIYSSVEEDLSDLQKMRDQITNIEMSIRDNNGYIDCYIEKFRQQHLKHLLQQSIPCYITADTVKNQKFYAKICKNQVISENDYPLPEEWKYFIHAHDQNVRTGIKKLIKKSKIRQNLIEDIHKPGEASYDDYGNQIFGFNLKEAATILFEKIKQLLKLRFPSKKKVEMPNLSEEPYKPVNDSNTPIQTDNDKEYAELDEIKNIGLDYEDIDEFAQKDVNDANEYDVNRSNYFNFPDVNTHEDIKKGIISKLKMETTFARPQTFDKKNRINQKNLSRKSTRKGYSNKYELTTFEKPGNKSEC